MEFKDLREHIEQKLSIDKKTAHATDIGTYLKNVTVKEFFKFLEAAVKSFEKKDADNISFKLGYFFKKNTLRSGEREVWQLIDDIWNKYKTMYPNLKIPLRFIDEQAGLEIGTCSYIYYKRAKDSIHKQALLQCERAIK